jgi:hypothetical protein
MNFCVTAAQKEKGRRAFVRGGKSRSTAVNLSSFFKLVKSQSVKGPVRRLWREADDDATRTFKAPSLIIS